MTIDEFLKKYAEQHGNDTSYEDAKKLIIDAQNAGAKMVAEGNTLFLFLTNDDGVCEFQFLNADKESVFAKNLKDFLNLAKKIGYSKAMTDCDDSKELNMVKQALSRKFKFTSIQNSVEVNL
jgi:hypothetical protein